MRQPDIPSTAEVARVPDSTELRGNFVSEWFGHRMHPVVAATNDAIADQALHRCPFLSAATRDDHQCIKPLPSHGVCTISSTSNGPRQDWLVCPFRALDPTLLHDTARRLFSADPARPALVVPAPALAKEEVRRELGDVVNSGAVGLVYLQSKLGGEISLPPTSRSPELALDVVLVEIVREGEGFGVGRYGILEIQTMDFHGSYRHAVNKLKSAQTLFPASYPSEVRKNPHWLSDHVEGPNISNVFKRTFYQTILKFQIAANEPCAGCVLALPAAVWDSWQRHLGRPELQPLEDGTFALGHPERQAGPEVTTWILVFDVEVSTTQSPNPIRTVKAIATDAAALRYYALEVAPQAAVAAGAASTVILAAIRRRLAQWWPDLDPGSGPRRRSRQHRKLPEAPDTSAG
jgi:hypothetical protein